MSIDNQFQIFINFCFILLFSILQFTISQPQTVWQILCIMDIQILPLKHYFDGIQMNLTLKRSFISVRSKQKQYSSAKEWRKSTLMIVAYPTKTALWITWSWHQSTARIAKSANEDVKLLLWKLYRSLHRVQLCQHVS